MTARAPERSRPGSILAEHVVVDHDTVAGPVRALECERLQIAAGESVAVMGPSGCGKSTLLGVLAGLATPTHGSVTVGGETVSSMSARDRGRFRRRSLGMVYQSDNLLPHLTVEENVGLQLAICRRELRHREADAARSDPGQVLDRLGLAGLAGRLPDQLSGGQRQRAAVARAVINAPAVLLADEPTGALDGASAQSVIELLMDVHRRLGATLVLVTHDPQIAGRLDRIVHLAGRTTHREQTHAV